METGSSVGWVLTISKLLLSEVPMPEQVLAPGVPHGRLVREHQDPLLAHPLGELVRREGLAEAVPEQNNAKIGAHIPIQSVW